MPKKPTAKRFTGYHMAAILVGFFGTVMAVNFTMAGFAIGSFGGIQVQNSYIASQKFNGWLDKAQAQEALGWDIASSRRADGHVAVQATGPGAQAMVSAHARQPVGATPDQELAFTRQTDGTFLSQDALPTGRWIVRLQIEDGSDSWRREDRL